MSLRARLLRTARGAGLPPRTVRLRLTVLYSALFLASGAALLAITYVSVRDATDNNSFVIHGKNGLTIAGFQIGAPLPKSSPTRLRFSSSGLVATRAHSSSGGGGFGVAGLTSKQMREQTEQLLALAQHTRLDALHELLIKSGIALAIMAVLSVVLGWIVAGRVLRPLRTITATARDISATNLHQRLDLVGPDDELKELGDTIDGLLERLEASFRSQRQFVANASHELRTPLARQRTLAQVALADPDATVDTLRAAHERILASGEQQEQLIDALLTLSKVQGGTVRRQRGDLPTLVWDLLEAREAEAELRDIHLIPALGAAALEGDPRLVERMVANLLDNALRYNVAGGAVVVRTRRVHGRATLEVSNDGPVVDPADVERLFEPFARLAPERTASGEGFGLGLCIVRAVVAAHDATLRTEVRPKGGLRIRVEFPAPATEPSVPAGPATDGAHPAPCPDAAPSLAGDRVLALLR
jgi:signal transduction histidine kinase